MSVIVSRLNYLTCAIALSRFSQMGCELYLISISVFVSVSFLLVRWMNVFLCVWIYNLAITSGCYCFAFEFSSSSPNHFQNRLYVCLLALCVFAFLCVFLNVSLANANSRCKRFVDV